MLKADDVPCQDPGQFLDWITPKFSSVQKGSRLTKKRIKDLVVGDNLQLRERELFLEMLYNQEKAIAFNFLHIKKVRLKVVLP